MVQYLVYPKAGCQVCFYDNQEAHDLYVLISISSLDRLLCVLKKLTIGFLLDDYFIVWLHKNWSQVC